MVRAYRLVAKVPCAGPVPPPNIVVHTQNAKRVIHLLRADRSGYVNRMTGPARQIMPAFACDNLGPRTNDDIHTQIGVSGCRHLPNLMDTTDRSQRQPV